MSIVNKHQSPFIQENQFLNLTKLSTPDVHKKPGAEKLTQGVSQDYEIGMNLSSYSQNNVTEKTDSSEATLYENSYFDSDILDLNSNKSDIDYKNIGYSDISQIFGKDANSTSLNLDNGNSYSAITSALNQTAAAASIAVGYSDESSLSGMISSLKGMQNIFNTMPPQPRSSNIKKCKNGLYKDKSTGIYYQKDAQYGWYVQVANYKKGGHK